MATKMKSGKTGYWDRDRILELYFKEIDAYPLLTKGDEKELAIRIRAGDKSAFKKLVSSNLRFVVTVAKKYQNRGLTLPDLIAEGNLGLIRAAQKFDENRKVRFISYAVWWIRQSILQALADQTRVFRIPINRSDMIHKLRKKANNLRQKLGREPTREELSEGTSIELKDVDNLQSVTKSPLSLDNPIFFGDDGRLLRESIPDDGKGPDDVTFINLRWEAIEEVLATLSEKETIILTLYYGLGDRDPMTLEEIGSILGITRERVRQIKERALERLRHISRSRKLKSFLS